MLKRLTLVAAIVVSLVITATPAQAVTDGSLDNGAHPYVGLMVFEQPDGRFRCSGTLIAPQLFLTAGHCTFGVIGKVQVWFAEDVETHRCRISPPTVATCSAADPDWNGYPLIGEVSGTAFAHPDYNDAAFFLRDLGVVVLDTPVTGLGYGVLPAVDRSDGLKVGPKSSFTSVGYGLQKAYPTAASFLTQGRRVRMVSHPFLLQVNGGLVGDFSLLLSNNTHTGGTCFGDSGGPNFYGTSNVVAGVTSFGLNSTCGGTGGVYRVDRDWNLDWLAGFLD